MAKKSQAQIKRMMKRAEARGEVYEAPPPEEEKNKQVSTDQQAQAQAQTETEETTKLKAAKKLKSELEAIENAESLKSKDRRSAKRKAEAIALESTGCPAEELLQWYEKQHAKASSSAGGKKSDNSRKRKNPYIVFMGQLSYTTTRESLFEHIKTEIGKEHDIRESTVKIRLLTDPKTKKSRGMAFVELNDPETMYSCLKLHQTMLEGRRLNVERSAGGGKNSENRKAKIKQFRTEQDEYMSTVVNKMLDEYKQSGEIKEGELDEGVIALCTRHSAAVVEASLERYVESNGREMDNPSAYLSFLLTKLADEGIYDREEMTSKQDPGKGPQRKRQKYDKADKSSSEFAKQGFDMKASFSSTGEPQYNKIFPSMGRGRGRS